MEQQEIVRMLKIVESIDNTFTYANAVSEIFYGNFSKRNTAWVCANLGLYIPETHLYEAYKEALSAAESGEYNQFFRAELLAKVRRINHHDTINNPILQSQLDADGYLTIYHGHTKKTLAGSNSWSLSPKVAHFFGRRNALFNAADEYYVVTGKCRPEDIIAYITDRKEEEIVILNKNVKDKSKVFYPRPKED